MVTWYVHVFYIFYSIIVILNYAHQPSNQNSSVVYTDTNMPELPPSVSSYLIIHSRSTIWRYDVLTQLCQIK
jgi:hypothetical protein